MLSDLQLSKPQLHLEHSCISVWDLGKSEYKENATSMQHDNKTYLFQLFLNVGKTREHIHVRLICVDQEIKKCLHEIAQRVCIHTVRAITIKFKTTGVVTNKAE
ncbi:hypothetical protein ATANTOWER_030118 [Ataeniobius toweri]|uniref:Uncharacterized protein n=1 Tax=Ataeniobius toweri TaxID=208326 RepID=A0ABU7BZ09_9TELE|nr:hypothetical protein [Ataeniobius toweri]